MPRLAATPIKDSQLYINEVVRLAPSISPLHLLVELNKVYRSGVEMNLKADEEGEEQPITIMGSFEWFRTPQGGLFWANLHNGN